MTLRWCAFTGALMLALVAATYMHQGATRDPEGVVTRWWDGTMESKEVRLSDGRLVHRVEYGDDGKTIITLREWNYRGALIHSKLRQKDGTVEEKVFNEDGKVLLLHKLWNGDELTFRSERTFRSDGSIESETIMTEDGLVPAERRQFDRDGKLSMESRVLDNADQQTDMYRNGKVFNRSVFKANGDSWEEMLSDDGRVKMRSKSIRLTGERESEGFTPSGKLLFRQKNDPQTNTSVREVFEGDKVRLRQYYKGWGMIKVEEISLETGKVTRVYGISEDQGILASISTFRADGTLETVQQLEVGDRIVKTLRYDAEGKNPVISDNPKGETAVYDQDVFLDDLQLLDLAEKGVKR